MASVRVGLMVVLATSACSPRLYSEPGTNSDWELPENTWTVGETPEDLEGEGFAEGQLALDVRGDDQHGDEVSLWQFYGNYILLDISTMWCGPCQELAIGTEEISQDFKDDGVVYLTVLLENELKEGPTTEELELWSTFPSFHPDPNHPYDVITSPIISDPLGESGSSLAVRNNVYPVALLIGPDMRVIDRIEPVTDARIHEVLDEVVRGIED